MPVRRLPAVGLLCGFVAAALLTPACRMVEKAAPADLILRGGRVYVRPVTLSDPTHSPRTLWLLGGTAVACRAGRVAYVGDDKGTERFRGASSRVVDLHGAWVVAGSEAEATSPSANPALVLEPGAPAELTVFDEDPFAREGDGAGRPAVLFRVERGVLRPVLQDAPVG